MITVAIFINGAPLVTRSAVDQQRVTDSESEYKTDSGLIVLHNKEKSVVELAKKLLDTVDQSVI